MNAISEKLQEPFSEDQIEWRIGQAGKTKDGRIWATCLAYVQSRAIMDRLDEVFGPFGWRDKYEHLVVDGEHGFLCTIECKAGGIIKDGRDFEAVWISKQDGAPCTNIEGFKGGISDALKRAAVKLGIGRYLYSLEAGFAQILEGREPGAKKAKTPDGTWFFWRPPALPSWALPKE